MHLIVLKYKIKFEGRHFFSNQMVVKNIHNEINENKWHCETFLLTVEL